MSLSIVLMQSTEEPTVAQVVKQVVQYSIGRRFDPSHRQRKTEREREREKWGRGERERNRGRERDGSTHFFRSPYLNIASALAMVDLIHSVHTTGRNGSCWRHKYGVDVHDLSPYYGLIDWRWAAITH